MSYSITLDVFEGPMDLLLKLIDENQVDIYDIPIAIITDQYIAYIDAMEEIDLDILSDFLLMAATLIRIKSKMLVPQHKADEEEEEEPEEDPRQELVRKLVEYRRFKMLAEDLLKRSEGDVPRVYYREEEITEDPEIELKATLPQLLKAFKTVWLQKEDEPRVYELPQGDVDVAEKMAEILDRLEASAGGLILQDLFITAVSRREALAMFLALLELIRLSRVKATQPRIFGPITIQLMRGVLDAS
ncbi:MAG: segregation and condensation protein A [Acidobacteriota bacterium]